MKFNVPSKNPGRKIPRPPAGSTPDQKRDWYGAFNRDLTLLDESDPQRFLDRIRDSIVDERARALAEQALDVKARARVDEATAAEAARERATTLAVRDRTVSTLAGLYVLGNSTEIPRGPGRSVKWVLDACEALEGLPGDAVEGLDDVAAGRVLALRVLGSWLASYADQHGFPFPGNLELAESLKVIRRTIEDRGFAGCARVASLCHDERGRYGPKLPSSPRRMFDTTPRSDGAGTIQPSWFDLAVEWADRADIEARGDRREAARLEREPAEGL